VLKKSAAIEWQILQGNLIARAGAYGRRIP
jgi:hypothetical protein